MKRVAAFVDGGLILHALQQVLRDRDVTAPDVLACVESCLDAGEILDELYFYDRCRPRSRARVEAGAPSWLHQALYPTAAERTLLRDLRATPGVKVRTGRRMAEGWKLLPGTIQKAAEQATQGQTYQISPDDLAPDLQQPRVDMVLGLDVASVCHLALIDQLLFLTEDPAMETVIQFARREGMPTTLAMVPGRSLPSELRLIPGGSRTASFLSSPMRAGSRVGA